MLTLLIRDDFASNAVRILLADLNAAGEVRAVAQPITMKALPVDARGAPILEAALSADEAAGVRLGRDQAQVLADRLWDLGYRPAGSHSSAGALAQAESHIASLREVTRALLPK